MCKKLLLLPMIPLLLLSACQGGEAEGGQTADEAARLVRTEYLAAAGCAGRVEVTADYGARVYAFTLDFTWRREGESTLSVVAPEELAGLTARIADGEGRLEFDGVSLGAGDLTGEGLTPMELLPSVMEYVGGGYMAECVFEALGGQDALRVLFRDPEAQAGSGTECVLWFDCGARALLRCELSWDGALVLSGDFTEFEFTGVVSEENAFPAQESLASQDG